MKRLFVFYLLTIGAIVVNAQTYELNIDAQVLKNYAIFKKGSKVHIQSMTHEVTFSEASSGGIMGSSGPRILDSYTLNTDAGSVNVKDKLEKVLEVNYSDAQSFWDAQIIFNVLEQLSKRGTQQELRAEIEEEVLEYINWLQIKGSTFNDPYLESYIYGLISKIAPSILIDGRPGNINLLIVRDPVANACMFLNGTLIISTGLISLLHSEDELAAILAHEIAHFVLDHSIQNYNKMQSKMKRAEFWAGVSTALAGVAEGAVAINNPYYTPGGATIAVAAASSQIALEVCKRFGMQYNRNQESEADDMATELMKVLKYDPNALSTALSRIEEALKKERSVEMYFASDHPALVDRIKKAGTPSLKKDVNFEKIISFAVSDAATIKIMDRRFRQALPLVSQNINNNVATVDDYIQKANCLLYLRNDANTFTEIGSLINEAKKMSIDNINLYKTEILYYLRQKKYKEALSLLTSYKQKLSDMTKNRNILPEELWLYTYRYANSELIWANNMSDKLRSF